MASEKLSDLIDMSLVQTMADSHYLGAGMPIGIIDAFDGSILVGAGWQDICVKFHRTHPETLHRCHESDDHIKQFLKRGETCQYKCKNGLWDIGIPIFVKDIHVATIFLGQFFYEDEKPDRNFFVDQATAFGFDLKTYLEALDKVPVFTRERVDYVLEYNKALARFMGDLAEQSLARRTMDYQLLESRQNMEQREAELRSIFKAAPTGIGMVVNRVITWVNHKMCLMTGYTEQELLNASSRILYPDQETCDKVGRDKYEQILQTGTGTVETVFLCKDGTLKDILLSSTPIDPHCWESGVTFTALDITDAKRDHQQLLKYQNHLEQLVAERTAQVDAKNKELETFTYSVSHDLKAPLRGIEGYSRLLMEGYRDQLDTEGQLFIDNVRKATSQMNQLIEDLLTYSRAERRDLQNRDIQLTDLTDMLTRERSHDLESREVTLNIAFPFNTVHCDFESLQRTLRNLLDNAIKFSANRPGATVEMGGEETPDSWTVWVKDNGIGFDPKYQERIFNIFQRLEYSEDYPGTGVGLAIVRKAVHRMGGDIHVTTSPGNGAQFYLKIPKPDLSGNKEQHESI